MPEYRIRSTGEVLSDQEFRRRHKNTSFSRLLDENLLDAFDTDIVFEGPQKQGPPPYSYTYRDGVEKIGDKWYTKYTIGQRDKEPIDKKYAENIRIRRDILIKESDWRAVSDRELESEWKEYRQALRDISKQEGFPHDVKWPVDPDGNNGDAHHC
tara:strand:+ start:1406 stop:1870 length:465 start_codon:yes stop_codon:yes gene_type:complete